jgi:lipopolysaccharide export system protein LptA
LLKVIRITLRKNVNFLIKLKVGLYKYKRVAGIILLLFTITYAFGQNNAPETNQDNTINSETNTLLIKDQASDSLNITKPLLIPANRTDSAFQITNISDSTSEYSMQLDSANMNTTPPDSLSTKTDLLDSAALSTDLLDSAALSADLLDSAALAADSIPPVGDIETTIRYSARDSMNLSLTNQNVDLYGDGKIVYGDIELSADRVNVDYEIHEIQAEGTEDSLGNPVGEPIFKDGPDVYETEKMRYNFKSEKAIIKGVVTQQGEGIMHGNTVKRDQRGDLYIDRAKYTTCNRPDPHFHIEAKKLKLVPDDKIMVGPFHMRVNDIPLPVGWGFGMFPMPRTQ